MDQIENKEKNYGYRTLFIRNLVRKRERESEKKRKKDKATKEKKRNENKKYPQLPFHVRIWKGKVAVSITIPMNLSRNLPANPFQTDRRL